MDKNNFKPRFFVIVHAQHDFRRQTSLLHAVMAAKVASDNHADGIILIPDYASESNGYSQKATLDDLFHYHAEIKKFIPGFAVGVNFLQRFENMRDDLIEAIVVENFTIIQSDESLAKTLPCRIPNTEFFSGLAFKYSQTETLTGEALRKLCENVPREANVIPTTSGTATGVPPTLEKIREIREYLPKEKRLAIASGITSENASSFLEAGVTDFLVATSLIKERAYGFDILDPEKIKNLAKIVKCKF